MLKTFSSQIPALRFYQLIYHDHHSIYQTHRQSSLSQSSQSPQPSLTTQQHGHQRQSAYTDYTDDSNIQLNEMQHNDNYSRSSSSYGRHQRARHHDHLAQSSLDGSRYIVCSTFYWQDALELRRGTESWKQLDSRTELHSWEEKLLSGL